MPHEILTVSQSYEADRLAAVQGVPPPTLMENAGRAVADEICRRWTPRQTTVLCGPGNNGGDGFVVARLLKERGWSVALALYGVGAQTPRDSAGIAAQLIGDAAAMAARWDELFHRPSTQILEQAELVVDAVFGAGLSRPLSAPLAAHAKLVKALNKPVVAIDVPSGLHGDRGRPLGEDCFEAHLTVTFFRKKPAHVLMPGRLLCGEIVVADIGIPGSVIESVAPRLFENDPGSWIGNFPRPQPAAHKYARGHCVVVSGPAHATGAARLAARGALRMGAGLVSVASPPDAVPINAAALTAIMVKPVAGAEDLARLLEDRRFNSVVIGPGCGVGEATKMLAAAVLGSGAAAVLDADALTSFAGDPEELYRLLRQPAVLTPHEGEFERIFPDLLANSQNRIEAARAAAASAGCTVLLKGPDTVIASPDGLATVNTHAPPALATAGSGDVLAGLIGGLMAQRVDSYTAACMAAWLHGEAAFRFGPGLIAEDLPEQMPAVLRQLEDRQEWKT